MTTARIAGLRPTVRQFGYRWTSPDLPATMDALRMRYPKGPEHPPTVKSALSPAGEAAVALIVNAAQSFRSTQQRTLPTRPIGATSTAVSIGIGLRGPLQLPPGLESELLCVQMLKAVEADLAGAQAMETAVTSTLALVAPYAQAAGDRQKSPDARIMAADTGISLLDTAEAYDHSGQQYAAAAADLRSQAQALRCGNLDAITQAATDAQSAATAADAAWNSWPTLVEWLGLTAFLAQAQADQEAAQKALQQQQQQHQADLNAMVDFLSGPNGFLPCASVDTHWWGGVDLILDENCTQTFINFLNFVGSSLSVTDIVGFVKTGVDGALHGLSAVQGGLVTVALTALRLDAGLAAMDAKSIDKGNGIKIRMSLIPLAAAAILGLDPPAIAGLAELDVTGTLLAQRADPSTGNPITCLVWFEPN